MWRGGHREKNAEAEEHFTRFLEAASKEENVLQESD